MVGSPPTRVSIPSLKATAAIVALGLQADGAMQVPDNAAEVGWFTKAPTPGSLGPGVLAGHVNWKGRRGVFFDLGKLPVGAEITVDRHTELTLVNSWTGPEFEPSYYDGLRGGWEEWVSRLEKLF